MVREGCWKGFWAVACVVGGRAGVGVYVDVDADVDMDMGMGAGVGVGMGRGGKADVDVDGPTRSLGDGGRSVSPHLKRSSRV